MGHHPKTTLERLQKSPADTVIVSMSGTCKKGGTAVLKSIVPEQFFQIVQGLYFLRRRRK